MKRVYVAGPYSASGVIEVLNNIRRGIQMAVRVLLAGHAPFCPWLDFQYILMFRENQKVGVKDMYKMSLKWLEVSDLLLVQGDWEKSAGTLGEIEFAKNRRIPIAYGYVGFREWLFKENKNDNYKGMA